MGISIGGYFRIAVATVVSFYSENWYILANQIAAEEGRRKRDSNNRRARREFNAAQKDRLVMVDLLPDQARTLCLGRVRYVEGVRRRWSSGTFKENATLIVSFAGHEIDGYEQWYLDDLPVTLDAEGWVLTAPYGGSSEVAHEAAGFADGSGNASITLASAPTPGSVRAVWSSGAGENLASGTAAVTVSGLTALVTGVSPGVSIVVLYTVATPKRSVRIRPYLGLDTQNIGADIAAEYPGFITANDKFAGIAAAVVDFIFDPDTFPQSFPAVVPVFRGAKCYDPRTGLTVWTENVSLCTRRYITWEHGPALRSQDYVETDVVRAADVCDVSTAFTVLASDGSTSTVTLPRYRCGLTIPADADHGQALTSLMQAMAGSDAWPGGQYRFRAGHMREVSATIDASWLVSNLKADGTLEEDPVVSVVHALPREQRINFVSGKCVDGAQRYQLLPYPAVKDAALIAAKGERRDEIDYPGVNHIAHAQHLANIAIREAQSGMQARLRCGAQALVLELFDVVTWTHPNPAANITNKTMEVVGWSWQPGQPFMVQLAEISAEQFNPATVRGRSAAPPSTLRRPWDVESMGALTVTSGTPALTDAGSVITRTRVQFPAALYANVRQGGRAEIQYQDATEGLPDPGQDWPTWPEEGTATEAIIPGLQAGRVYWMRGRWVQTQPRVRGPWSQIVAHRVSTSAQDNLAAGLADALNAAAAAQATADGKIDTFWQATAPTGASEGDLWFDTDDGLKQYRYTSGAWVLSADARLGVAIETAATAQATADGKVTTFLAAIAPTAAAVGDLWMDTDDGNRIYRWNGATWADLVLGTGAIAPGAVQEVADIAYDATGVSFSTVV